MEAKEYTKRLELLEASYSHFIDLVEAGYSPRFLIIREVKNEKPRGIRGRV